MDWNDPVVMGVGIFALLVYVALIGLVAWACGERKRNPGVFIALAIFCTPVVALLLLAAAGDGKPEPMPAPPPRPLPQNASEEVEITQEMIEERFRKSGDSRSGT